MSNKQKAPGKSRFFKGVVIYGVVLVVIFAAVLGWLWSFLAEYEASRTHIPVDAYMAQLTPEHIVDNSMDVLELVDTNIQSEESCRQAMLDALEGGFTYARKASECTENRQVYVIRVGKQVVGSFSIVTSGEGAYGFTPWVLESEEFDLSYLVDSQPLTVTVPEGYSVSVNGVVLDDSYIVETETEQYDILEDYYEEYDLPMIVRHTYEAGPFLNSDFTMDVTDPQGNPFEMDESYDVYAPIHNVDTAQEEELETFLADFLERYVEFAGCANRNRNLNFNRLVQYIVPGSKLVTRLREAMDGMQYAQSRGDEIVSIVVNHHVLLAEGVYLCDVTYKVDTTGNEGVVQTTTNTRIVIVENNGTLLVESMAGY